MKTLKSAVGLCVLLGLGCITGPNNGAAHSGTIVGAAFNVGGYWTSPSASIQVQVLRAPNLSVTDPANWEDLGLPTTSSATATVINGDSLYTWNVTVVPVPSSAFAARWPAGGLVKLRARSGPDGAYTFDEVTWTDCAISEYGAGTSGQNIGFRCQGLGRGVVAIVSTLNNPAELGTREFLNLKGDIGLAETDLYYGSWSAPASLPGFRSTYLYPGTGEVTATYYNEGDLGVGREMHCWSYSYRLGLYSGTACYVSNYSDTYRTPRFGNNDIPTALSNAVAHSGAFATVAMVTERPYYSTTPGPVNFVVFNADGNRAREAQLDNRNQHRSVPNNCLTCHGVDTGYNASAHSISGRANFLPFDVSAFRFSTASGYTRAAQEDAFRRLNRMVRDSTAPTAAITSLIDGAYADTGGVAATGAQWNDYHVPAAWQGGSTRDNVTLYNGVVKPYCRTCHVSAGAYRDFAEAADFANLKPSIMSRACQINSGGFMPHAEHPYRKFWASGARAYLNAWTGDTTGCKP